MISQTPKMRGRKRDLYTTSYPAQVQPAATKRHKSPVILVK